MNEEERKGNLSGWNKVLASREQASQHVSADVADLKLQQPSLTRTATCRRDSKHSFRNLKLRMETGRFGWVKYAFWMSKRHNERFLSFVGIQGGKRTSRGG